MRLRPVLPRTVFYRHPSGIRYRRRPIMNVSARPVSPDGLSLQFIVRKEATGHHLFACWRITGDIVVLSAPDYALVRPSDHMGHIIPCRPRIRHEIAPCLLPHHGSRCIRRDLPRSEPARRGRGKASRPRSHARKVALAPGKIIVPNSLIFQLNS